MFRFFQDWPREIKLEKWMIPYILLFFVVFAAWFGFQTHLDVQETEQILARFHSVQTEDIDAIEFRGEDGRRGCFTIREPAAIAEVVSAFHGAIRSGELSKLDLKLEFWMILRGTAATKPTEQFEGTIYVPYPMNVSLSLNSARRGVFPPEIRIQGWGPWVVEKFRKSPCRSLI